MLKAFVVRWLTVIGVVLTTASVLPAQFLEVAPPREEEWARDMIDKDQLLINFKSVAMGQDVYFKIRVKNKYKEEMQITSLATSCGCISWEENRAGAGQLLAPIVIPSGKEQTLILRLDTIRHPGEHKNKKATISFLNTVVGPALGRGTATIIVEGYVRKDVVVEPGSVNFGSVDPQKGAEQRIAISYAGRPDWKLLSATCNSPHLTAEFVEKSRTFGAAANVKYELIVKLKETAPVGLLRDQVILVTDDLNNPQIPIQVEARIESDIIVSPAEFGTMMPGKPKKITVVVRYTKLPPKTFRIEKFERTRSEDTIKIEKTSDFKPLHTFTLTFTPPNEPGPYEEDFYLTVSGRTDPIIFKARGSIQAAPADPGLSK
jgi:hypothetical protein